MNKLRLLLFLIACILCSSTVYAQAPTRSCRTGEVALYNNAWWQCTSTNTWSSISIDNPTLAAGVPTGTAFPSTCTVGNVIVRTDQPAGSNLFVCGTSNNWVSATGTGSGTVTGVSFGTVPSWLTTSVANSSTTPTLTVSAATGQTSHKVLGTGAGTSFGPISLTTSDLPSLSSSNLTDSATLLKTSNIPASGMVKSTGTAFADAASSDIISLFGSGACSGYLKSDGTCSTPSGGSGTVTSFSVTSVPSWLSSSVANATTTPALTLSAAGTQTSHQVIGTCGAGTSFGPCSLVVGDLPSGYLYSNLSGAPSLFNQTVENGGTPVTQRAKLNFAAGSNVTITPTDNGTDTTTFTIASTGGSGTVTLSGDTTGSGTGTITTTTSKVNGTSVPVNSAADQAIVTTAAATGSWASLPSCLDSGGQHLNYNTTTHSFSCGTTGGTAGSAAFNTITGGTNTQAAMVVGTGASLAPSGSGTITANALSSVASTSLSDTANLVRNNQTNTYSNQAAPATPAVGTTSVYVDSTNKVLAAKNDAGTVSSTVVPSTAASHQFATGVGANGAISYAQPASTDLSDVTNLDTNAQNYTAGAFTYDFSSAAHSLPAKKGLAASKPATCTQGEEYFATDATAGQNMYYCTAANTWTQQLNSGGGSGLTTAYTSVTFSATPTFTVTSTSSIQDFAITLTGNVTSSTLTATAATAGQDIAFKVCQDATGGRTFAWPSNVVNAGNIVTTANVCSKQLFRWDGTNAVAFSPMQTDGSTPGVQTSSGFLTFPTAPDTLAGIAATQTLTNKTISGSSNALSNVGLGSLVTQAADSVVMNASGSTAAPSAVAMPTCTSGADLYNTTTHTWSCVTTGGGGTPGGTTGQPQFNGGGSFAGESNTVVINGGTGALAATTFVAGTTYVLTANDTESTGITLSVNNVTIQCGAGVTITRSAAITLFSISGSYDIIKGCIIDGGSQTAAGTGPLLLITGSHNTVANNVIQNPGTTNPTEASIYLSAGTDNVVSRNRFSLTADVCVSASPAANTTIADVTIDNNWINFNPGGNTLGCIMGSDNASNSTLTGLKILHNTVVESGTGALAYQLADGIAANGDRSTQGQQIIGNSCYPAARSNGCYKLYGTYKSIVSDNYGTDGGFAESFIFNFGDTYDTAITGNVAQATGGYAYCYQLIDYGRDSVTGNTCTGNFSNAVAGYIFTTIVAAGNDSVISSNILRFASAGSGAGFYMSSGGTAQPTQDNTFVGNHVIGTGTTGQIGFQLVDSTGTISNIFLNGNQIANVPTGISIGTGVSSTQVGPNSFDTVTTPVSDSGTSSLITTHTVRTSTTLASGTGTVTFSGLQVFTGSTTYQGSCNDSTAASAVKIAITSGTSATLTGTSTDVIKCTWTGY